ncbi:MAG TPA: hypothetical protein VD735_00505 [Candidatus Saccharimonadales bacterium]|nr:hypothetical protein [Candidatus Saccharimonadales bacterium]
MHNSPTKTAIVEPDIAGAVVLAILPWIFDDSSFLELLRWAAIMYLLGAALIHKFFSVKNKRTQATKEPQ